MVINMEEAKLQTLVQIKAFLEGTTEVAFRVPKAERNQFIERVFKRFGYARHGRVDKGVLLRYLERMTGLSRQQVTRLVRQYRKEGRLAKPRQRIAPTNGFTCRYTLADVALLAEMDVLHSTLSGPATKKLMERAHQVFGDVRFERLAGISVSHLYNLRASRPYQHKRRHWTKTNPTGLPIGKRRAPQPNGMPGYIRIDSVHQGDQDGVKGVYHINAVDCVTQFQLVATCERISEAYLLPVIRQLLEGFPFVILGFHADNGSEYINYRVAKLLEKLRVEFTKSRPRHSNDNALAESKNASVVRKHLGYTHIPQHCASLVNTFCVNHLNPYVNFHRPCFFPETITDAKGKERKRYRYEQMRTPYEKLKSLSNAMEYLKPGITFEQLDVQAAKMSDNEAALAMNNARKKLFQAISAAMKKRA
ncbi:MAG: DDE-type integrase/transposase/recombinase [Gallionella sp.]|jgi:transposase InsO family protein|nr:DDE-type integrase/transposase/recombinase [Gallionella sp.]